MNWQSEKQLEALIKLLVSWDSRSGTKGEIDFPHKLKNELTAKLGMLENLNVDLIDSGLSRNAVAASYVNKKNENTVVLISHFDTVHTEEFGKNEHLAFDVDALTEYYKENAGNFKPEIQEDITSDAYLFGRGIMDMKMGLALHLNILEK